MIDKPSDYPLRSLASRAAARVMLDRIKAEKEKDADSVSLEFYPTQRGRKR